MWVRDQEGVGLVLLKGFCDRMRDARVAKRIVREMSGEEKEGVGEGMGGQVLGWYKEAGFAVRMEDGDGARLVMDCF